MKNSTSDAEQRFTGLIPCAGYANRVSPLPCSKEIFPIEICKDEQTGSGQGAVKVISTYLLERFRTAGVATAHLIIRKGKWDIPDYYGTGEAFGIHLIYHVVNPTNGVSDTIDKAYPFIKNKHILFGFPDIYFEPENAYQQLLNHQEETRADVVLGLFQADNPQKADMVDINSHGRVSNIQIKPDQTDLVYTWMIAVWSPKFTEFLHQRLSEFDNHIMPNSNLINAHSNHKELHIGHIFQLAIYERMHINSMIFTKGRYIDIGTPEDLKRVLKF